TLPCLVPTVQFSTVPVGLPELMISHGFSSRRLLPQWGSLLTLFRRYPIELKR
ncbi:hypothetical protein PanWU01x14_038250, partial [Parasponia andersonii]